MAPVRSRALSRKMLLIPIQVHDNDLRKYDFQSSFVFTLFPHEEVWHRIPDVDATDYNQSCSYDRLCVGIGSRGTAIALHQGGHTPKVSPAIL